MNPRIRLDPFKIEIVSQTNDEVRIHDNGQIADVEVSLRGKQWMHAEKTLGYWTVPSGWLVRLVQRTTPTTITLKGG